MYKIVYISYAEGKMWKKESKKNLKANRCVSCTFTSNHLNLPENLI